MDEGRSFLVSGPPSSMTRVQRCDSILRMTHSGSAANRWFRPLALLGVLVGFAVRLFHLGGESLWYDETVSALLATHSLPAILAHTAGDIHPPAYYLLLHGWHWLTTPTPQHGLEFLLAWPSLFFGMMLLVLLHALGRRLGSPLVGLLALWIAALHPYQIWYSQEVRMYTLGACCGLLCLWALLQILAGHAKLRWYGVYTLSAAMGFYTLYYFLFLWATLNLLALSSFWRQRARVWPGWVGAQLATLILWSPWLPIFWRQATDPPVPGWRTAWPSWLDLLASLGEGLAALLIGQSAPRGIEWPWALLTLLLIGAGIGYAARNPARRAALLLSLGYVVLPSGLIYLLSLLMTPLYHVRYLFTYAPPFVLICAFGLAGLWHWRPRWAALLLIGLGVASAASLQSFWHAPAHRADDHRQAVALLAEQWRPGDLILVNAGWVYPAVQIYWPRELGDPLAALPPGLPTPLRLGDDAIMPSAAPQIIRTGSVDGPATLGWADPASDFFAVSAEESLSALDELANQAERIWHYRLYDTVSDPAGVIRTWLETKTTRRFGQSFAGRDFLRLELYEVPRSAGTPLVGEAVATFAEAVALRQIELPTTVQAGERLYLQSEWQALGASPLPTLALSLRLYADTADQVLVAQADAPLLPPTEQWQRGQQYQLPLALSIPAATKPGTYRVALVLYTQADGQALPIDGAAGESSFALGTVQVARSSLIPAIGPALARFDYLELLAVMPSQFTASSGGEFPVAWIWRARPSAYRDTYLARLLLQSPDGQTVQRWETALGGWEYPTGEWPPLLPVRDQQRLLVDPQVPAGRYQLLLQVVRQSDQALIPARRAWWQPARAEWLLGDVDITP